MQTNPTGSSYRIKSNTESIGAFYWYGTYRAMINAASHLIKSYTTEPQGRNNEQIPTEPNKSVIARYGDFQMADVQCVRAVLFFWLAVGEGILRD
jgi:hypothetical protein